MKKVRRCPFFETLSGVFAVSFCGAWLAANEEGAAMNEIENRRYKETVRPPPPY